MENQEINMGQYFKVSTTTGAFISSLKSFQQFQNEYLDALSLLYGEKKGNDEFNDDFTILNAVVTRVLERANESIKENVSIINSIEI